LNSIAEEGINHGNGSVTITFIAPEPSSFVLLALGLVAIPALRRWRSLPWWGML
jgi:hypothetical protein